MGIDLEGVDANDKLSRNIHIGKMMGENPRLTSVLREATIKLINDYIALNNIKEEEIILNQYDGFLTQKYLKERNLHVPLEIKNIFEVFIISNDRQKYIARDRDGTVVIKGVSNRYEEMDKIYEKIAKINFSIKTAIFNSLQKIKDEVLFSDNPELYCIPSNDKNYYNVYFRQLGKTKISKDAVDLINPSDVDRELYFNNYVRKFTESIVRSFV
jgi:hypothetical protein